MAGQGRRTILCDSQHPTRISSKPPLFIAREFGRLKPWVTPRREFGRLNPWVTPRGPGFVMEPGRATSFHRKFSNGPNWVRDETENLAGHQSPCWCVRIHKRTFSDPVLGGKVHILSRIAQKIYAVDLGQIDMAGGGKPTQWVDSLSCSVRRRAGCQLEVSAR